MLQKNFPKNLQPRFCGDPRLKQPDSTLVERLGANVIQFKVPGQDENVLKSLRAQKSDIRITGIYDSHGSTQSTNDFLFQYVIHPSHGDVCIYCQLDIDGENEGVAEPDESDDPIIDTNQIVPAEANEVFITTQMQNILPHLGHILPMFYSLTEVLARRDVNIHIPDPTGVLQSVLITILPLNEVIRFSYFGLELQITNTYFIMLRKHHSWTH